MTGPNSKERYFRAHREGRDQRIPCCVQSVCSGGFGLRLFFGGMAPHLTPAELDFIHSLETAGRDPAGIHQALSAQRARKKIAAPHITNVRKALKGNTYKRGRKETRGRRAKYSKKMVLRMDKARKDLAKKVSSGREVLWRDIRKAARVPDGHRSTLKNAFAREGINVAARRPREKPRRTPEHIKERFAFAKAMAAHPPSYYEKRLDMIIDNKKFDIPTTERARQYMKNQRVRFHLRTPAEGIKDEFTKPGRKKNRMNTGAQASVCAGISNGRVVLWHYLPKTWNGTVAADLYTNVIHPSLQKHRGIKRSYVLLEDNDPTGYKSNAAKSAKAACGIKAHAFPRYSPDINPLDFSIWNEIERRMVENSPKKLETVAAYKRRLRTTALRLPDSFVSKTVRAMAGKLRQMQDAKGHHIRSD